MTRFAQIYVGAAVALLVLGVAGCSKHEEQEGAALNQGRDAVTPCRERFHDEGQTYRDCVSYVATGLAQKPGLAGKQLDWARLGALYTGWVHADLAGQQGDVDAGRAARVLLPQALALQQKLHASDAQLCAMIGVTCATLANRRQETLAAGKG